jgi:hypothetical protein
VGPVEDGLEVVRSRAHGHVEAVLTAMRRLGFDKLIDPKASREDGAIAGIEVKASATVAAGDFSGLRKLADAAGKRFVFGVVLYDSDTIVPFGERLAAAPISCLWH